MEKKIYENPELEISRVIDVITSSNDTELDEF